MKNFLPSQPIRVGILGATGMVGQQYILLLQNHPWFIITYLAASPRSAGKKYNEVVNGRWLVSSEIPYAVKDLIVHDANTPQSAVSECDLVFSALELDSKEQLQALEIAYAQAGLPVVSNASAHRHTPDVPMLIPEINAHHLELISAQRTHHGWNTGCIVVKPNCSLQSYLTPMHALEQAGYTIDRIMVTTLQAVSGAGYPGVPSIDMIDNIVPFISGEEDKTEREPLKILGNINNNSIDYRTSLNISATCTRVPVSDGHTACVSVGFKDKKPTQAEMIEIWKTFKSLPQELDLPSAPITPIHYRLEDNRPQPKKDRSTDKAMAVTLGRLRDCTILDYKFIGVSHNTVRGAAGGGILNAELLLAQGYIK